jgi:hypothetical protein
VTFLIVMAVLVLAPYAGWLAGREIYRGDLRANAWERQHRVNVAAVLLEDSPVEKAVAADEQQPSTFPFVPARWVSPDGMVHTGLIVAETGSHAGSTAPIWIDDHGDVTGEPGHRSPVLDAVATGLLTGCVLTIGLVGIRRIVVWRLDRHRLRSWQTEWLFVGPRWTNR